MIELIYGCVLGLLAGLAFQRISVFQIKRRTEEISKVEAIDNATVIVVWMLLSAILFAVVFWREKETVARTADVLYMSVAVSIGVVDFDIRRIPNSSLLALLAVRTAQITYQLCAGGSFRENVLPAIIGLGVGFVLYMIPSLFKIPIGAGDVKYCAVIGYCLGITGFLQASLIMAVALVFYLIYLVARKKGSLKTATAMGPYLSLGVIVTLICPIFNNLDLPF